MRVIVNISGEKELLRKLKSLSDEIAGEYLKEAVLKGAEVIRQEASNKAPRRTGKLAANIIKEVKEIERDSATVEIGPAKEVFYGLFVERGTSRMQARPFLRPAIDEKKDEVEKVIISILRRRLGL